MKKITSKNIIEKINSLKINFDNLVKLLRVQGGCLGTRSR